jgi:hypothetical protein
MHYGHLPLSEAATLSPCRAQVDWEVCVEDSLLWVRAPQPSEDLWSHLPFTGRFQASGADRLIRLGESVPARRVPDQSSWLPLLHWMPVPRAPSLPGGVPPPPVELRPVRVQGEERPASMLIITRGLWEGWAVTAPEVRLQPLRFALASDGRVCVSGNPLPPLPGEAWVRHGAIALPAGYGIPEVCTANWLATRLNVPGDGVALWHTDGGSEVLPGTAFIPATRANIRASIRGLDPAH